MNLNRIFDPNNLFFREVSHIVDVVGLSLLWLVLCLPVVTIPPATAAVYHTAVKGLRCGDPATFSRFLRSFRENLKQGLVISLVFVPLALVFYLGFNVMCAAPGTAQGSFMLAIYVVAGLFMVGVFSYVFALLGRFRFTTGALFRTALQLALAHLPVTALVAVVNTAGVCLSGLLLWPVLLLPMLTALFTSFPLERVFAKYMEEPEDLTEEE